MLNDWDVALALQQAHDATPASRKRRRQAQTQPNQEPIRSQRASADKAGARLQTFSEESSAGSEDDFIRGMITREDERVRSIPATPAAHTDDFATVSPEEVENEQRLVNAWLDYEKSYSYEQSLQISSLPDAAKKVLRAARGNMSAQFLAEYETERAQTTDTGTSADMLHAVKKRHEAFPANTKKKFWLRCVIVVFDSWRRNRLTTQEAEQFVVDLIANSLHCHQFAAAWLLLDEDGSTFGSNLPIPKGTDTSGRTCPFPEASLQVFRHAYGIMFAKIIGERDRVQLVAELLEVTSLNRDMSNITAEYLGYSALTVEDAPRDPSLQTASDRARARQRTAEPPVPPEVVHPEDVPEVAAGTTTGPAAPPETAQGAGVTPVDYRVTSTCANSSDAEAMSWRSGSQTAQGHASSPTQSSSSSSSTSHAEDPAELD